MSLVYDSAPLENDMAILGWPRVQLQVSASAPLADWFARLSDVAPDGSVTLITGEGQSGAQRDSADDPEYLNPGEFYPLPIELHVTSWVFPKGHRIRLAISNRALADDLADALLDDHFSAARRRKSVVARIAVVPVEPPARPVFDRACEGAAAEERSRIVR